MITPEPGSDAPAPAPAETPFTSPLPIAPPAQPTAVTATPTVTPTPIVHVIQQGETLGAIALTYGVSVQALQVANGIDNPLLLQVGQELVIPTGEEVEVIGADSGMLLLPTPTPLSFGVRGTSFYETPVGSLDCLGEIVNTTAYTLTNVQVRVTLFDAAGAPLITGDAFAAADILPPSARAPFRVMFVSPPPNFVSHDVARLRGEFAGELEARYVVLAVDEVSGVPSGPQFQVTGAVRNSDPTQTTTSVVVIVTSYDGEGRVTGYRQQAVDVGDGLTPGATAPFEVLFAPHGDVPADFSVIALGRIQGEG